MVSKKHSAYDRNLLLQLIAITLSMLIAMTIFELLQQDVFPGISPWKSRFITILISTVAAVVAAYFALTKHRESEERYRKAIEHSNDGVIMVDNEGYLYVNHSFLNIFGYATKEEALGRTLMSNIHPDDRQQIMDVFRKRHEGESVPSRYEFRGIKKNGEIVFIEISATEITYNNKRISLGNIRDITERKQIEEEKLYSAKLESALEMAGTICHELNQPLQIITGYADLLLMESKKATRANKKLEAIKEQTLRMGTITKKLMGLQKYSTRDYVGATKIIDIGVKPNGNRNRAVVRRNNHAHE